MLQRSSSVKNIKITNAALSSVIQLGDSSIINGLNRAIAVQREKQLFIGDEEDFFKYPIFRRPIVIPPDKEEIMISSFHQNPMIHVNSINVIAFSSSSILHVGNTKTINMEARIKHIRQLLPRST
ncbi:spore germination protein GerPE [Robertmurraya korlensis]|uniref:spore germination protein GerPE n=1 Tax=Robertmurraya korlensis TaxID=519977 RepID=UPI000826E696|nr:spore germination protein GerPE [Robertmurraya korlensis]